MRKISYVFIQDLLKNKAILGYLFLLVSIGWGIFLIENQSQKIILSLLQITLLVLPLITIIFSTIYYYNSQEFVLLLLSQPIKRHLLMRGIFFGVSFTFFLTFLIGIGIPIMLFYPGAESLFLLLAGTLLTLIFTAFGFLIGITISDKAKGMGLAILVWAFTTFIYDGLILLLMYQLADYPIEQTVLILSFFNPVDIARILVIMQTEASALLGLSGAVFQDFFGSATGWVVSILVLLVWWLTPVLLSIKIFVKKDL